MYDNVHVNKEYVENLSKEIYSSLVEKHYRPFTKNNDSYQTSTKVPSLTKNYRSHSIKRDEIYKYIYGRNIVRP